MCKCIICDCYYCNCCKTFVGVGTLCCCFGTICYNSNTNLMPETCRVCCISYFCCKWVGYGHLNLGFSVVCCVP